MAQQREDIIRKLTEFNLLQEGQALEEALNLTVEDVMERRLQTQVVRNDLAKTMSQARQFIVHGHITVDGKKITSPSYQISRTEQFKIAFVEKSTLADEEHPERKAPEVVPKEDKAEPTEEEKLASAEEEVSKEIGEKIDADADEPVEEDSTKKPAEEAKEDKKDE